MLFDLIFSKITDARFLLMIASAIAAAATVVSIAVPLLEATR